MYCIKDTSGENHSFRCDDPDTGLMIAITDCGESILHPNIIQGKTTCKKCKERNKNANIILPARKKFLKHFSFKLY